MVNRAALQKLAEDRILDAELLLNGGRWSGAYYLAGYAIECGLKACILAHVTSNASVIFQERRYSEKCWTHELRQLLELAGLKAQMDADGKAQANLFARWGTVLAWKETSRYEEKTEAEARALYEAITHPTDGVLPWIRLRW